MNGKVYRKRNAKLLESLLDEQVTAEAITSLCQMFGANKVPEGNTQTNKNV
jgi:hypothetical protein